MEAGKEYLLFTPDKWFEGENLRAYKQLRSSQLFDERHVHDIELNEWEAGTYSYFVRAKCWPSQDTSKSAHKCIVCLDRVEPRIYGAHCRCVSGLGEACSHVAALLFALEDFCSRGYRSLQGPTVTEKTCKWSKPSAQKVDRVPMAAMRLEKACPGGRKRKRWSRSGISRVDTRHHEDYEPDAQQHGTFEDDLHDAVENCSYFRILNDLAEPPQTPGGPTSLPDEVSGEDKCVAVNREVEVDFVEIVECREEDEQVSLPTHLSRSSQERRRKLFGIVPVDIFNDIETVPTAWLQDAYAAIVEKEKLTSEQRHTGGAHQRPTRERCVACRTLVESQRPWSPASRQGRRRPNQTSWLRISCATRKLVKEAIEMVMLGLMAIKWSQSLWRITWLTRVAKCQSRDTAWSSAKAIHSWPQAPTALYTVMTSPTQSVFSKSNVLFPTSRFPNRPCQSERSPKARHEAFSFQPTEWSERLTHGQSGWLGAAALGSIPALALSLLSPSSQPLIDHVRPRSPKAHHEAVFFQPAELSERLTPGQSGWLGAAAVGSIPALALSFFNICLSQTGLLKKYPSLLFFFNFCCASCHVSPFFLSFFFSSFWPWKFFFTVRIAHKAPQMFAACLFASL